MIFLICCTLLPWAAGAQQGDFTLQGKLGKLDSPALVTLNYRMAGKDTSMAYPLQQGRFVFKGHLNMPVTAFLRTSTVSSLLTLS